MKDLEILSVTKRDLIDAINNNTYWNSNSRNIPFTKSKACWLIENTRINNDDICAILGYEKDVLVSFIYIIPDLINTPSGEKKIYWSRRWWVANKYKDSILSSYTRTFSFSAVNNQMLIKYIGEDTVTYYTKQPFTKFAERTKYMIVFSLDVTLLLTNIKALRKFKFFVNIASKLSYSLTSLINKIKNKKNTKNITYEYLSLIDNYAWNFINPFLKNDLVVKTKNYINWQISNTQYTHTEIKDKTIHYCLINSSAKKIYNLTFLVKKENKILGFISVLIKDIEFNVRYFVCSDEYFDICVDVLIDNFINSKTAIILTENEKLGKKIKEKYTSIYTKKRNLYSLAHNDVNLNTNNISINDRDGNFA